MRKIVFILHTGYCGSDGYDFDVFPDDVTDDELNQHAYDLALNNAEAYGIYPEESKPDAYDEEDEGDWRCDEYSSNIEGWWEDFDPKLHDGLVAGGGTATDLFERLAAKFKE